MSDQTNQAILFETGNNGEVYTLPSDLADRLSFHVRFPSCWDGVNVDSPDHKSHVRYLSARISLNFLTYSDGIPRSRAWEHQRRNLSSKPPSRTHFPGRRVRLRYWLTRSQNLSRTRSRERRYHWIWLPWRLPAGMAGLGCSTELVCELYW